MTDLLQEWGLKITQRDMLFSEESYSLHINDDSGA